MDLTGYKLVFEDDFNGTKLDLERWEHAPGRASGPIYPEMTKVENSNLIISYQFLENGPYGAQWYADAVRIKERFCKGYFECRCICSDPVDRSGFWSAFWIQGDHPYEPSIARGGPGGAEMDIIEAIQTWDKLLPAVEHNVHTAGYPDGSGEGLRSMGAVSVPVDTCYTDFHTYGLEWADEVYRFYVDGKCTLETAWAEGTSKVAEEVILTLCHPQKALEDKTRKGRFVIDYVRIYQKD